MSGCATKKRSAGALLEIEQTWSSHDSPKIKVKINDNEKEITLGTDRGYIEASLAACSKNEVVGQVYITFSDGSLVAVSLAKETVEWSREEGLSNLVAVELIDEVLAGHPDVVIGCVAETAAGSMGSLIAVRAQDDIVRRIA